MSAPGVHLLGIRHHGPGSARSVLRALDELRPDAVLVELPSDAQPMLAWLNDAELEPPVALLGYAVDDPRRAAFYPFASFSPEWVACRWALQRGVAVRAIDVPLMNSMAAGADNRSLAERPIDPLAELAAAAGDDDPERWWEDVIEHRGEGVAAFETVREAMVAVRGSVLLTSEREHRREAAMRTAIRSALAADHESIAVVCGAWHVPALAEPWPSATADAKLLRGMPKVKVAMSWVPWTHRRLASSSGYLAGVPSPGWYDYMFRETTGVERWFVDAARLLRDRGTLVSPDHVIAAARSSDMLAALRSRPRPGLAEVLDAAAAVMTDSSGMALIHDELIVGDALGRVPVHAPQVPLARDLANQQRAARLKPQAAAHTVELDLRTANGHRRSVLLHRLDALGVRWGRLQEGRGSSGTFRETWRLEWEPELSIVLIERAALGTTLASAATARLVERVDGATALADIVAVLDAALRCDLADAVAPCVRRLGEVATTDADVESLLDAVSPMASTLRYGDVRGTDVDVVAQVFEGLVVRVLAGLVDACRSLDDAAAAAMVERLAAAHAALALVEHRSRRDEWPATLSHVAERGDVHGLVQGRASRLLHDSGAWTAERVSRRVSRALSVGNPPIGGAAFVEGFLAGSGAVLVHDRSLLRLLDEWVGELAADAFIDTVPLLRRTFGSFEPAERRQLGALVADRANPSRAGFGDDVDPARAAAALATVRRLLGASQ
jgi:hypothetical protein